jgi:hypothetical protein
MKRGRLLFLLLTVSTAISMQQTSYAASPQQSSTQTSAGQDSDRPCDAHHAEPSSQVDHVSLKEKDRNGSDASRATCLASARNHSRSQAGLAASSKNRIPVPQKRSFGKSTNLQSVRADKSVGGKSGGVQNQTASNIPAVRPASAVRTTGTSPGPSFETARHHGPNPAVIAGSANSGHRDTGVIDGTAIHRRP